VRGLAVEKRLAAIGSQKAEDELDERRLPAAVGARDRDQLARSDIEVDVGQDGSTVTVGEGDAAQLDR
jgi:hypothetical protein